MKNKINLNKILEQESVKNLFQPIVSARKRSVTGFEALSRGIDTHGRIISPGKLFSHAASPENRLNLDRICMPQDCLISFRDES